MVNSLSLSHFASIVISLIGGLTVIAFRMRSSDKPTTLKKIIIPPLGMATGFGMFIVPAARIPWTWGMIAFVAGALLFSYPLIRASRFHVVDGEIYLKRSKMFIVFIFLLLMLRIVLHDLVEQYVSIMQTGGIFFILAFGMLVPWRLAMLREYKLLIKRCKEQGIPLKNNESRP